MAGRVLCSSECDFLAGGKDFAVLGALDQAHCPFAILDHKAREVFDAAGKKQWRQSGRWADDGHLAGVLCQFEHPWQGQSYRE